MGALKEKDIIYGEKFIAEHSTWPRRKLVTSSGLQPQQTTRRAIDINIVFVIMDESILNCSSQPSMVHWLSSSIFPFVCLFVCPAMVTSDQISLLLAPHPQTHTFSESL